MRLLRYIDPWDLGKELADEYGFMQAKVFGTFAHHLFDNENVNPKDDGINLELYTYVKAILKTIVNNDSEEYAAAKTLINYFAKAANEIKEEIEEKTNGNND